MRVLAVLLLCVAAVLVKALHELPERARGGTAYKRFLETTPKLFNSKAQDALIFNSRVDNFDQSSNATFAQRYFVDDQYWDGKDGPVFYNICGEGTCSGPPTGFVAALGEKYKALLISLEHRFYGESIPNDNASSENYKKYLSVEQAMADLSNFTDFYKEQVPAAKDVPWVVFGGSYPGALSSWYRSTYPDQSVGALSSSGVVNCIIDYYQFDMQVSASAGNECGNKIKAVQAAFKRAIHGSERGLQGALAKFYCEKDMAETDFYYMIADSWSMAIQYGGKTAQCAALGAITETSTDEQVMDTFAAFSNDYWGKDFCAGGFCKWF
jgi:pimeloyl-ACP methyl ester carboxylesterase